MLKVFLMQICPPQGCLHIFTQAEVNYVLDQATHIPEYPTRYEGINALRCKSHREGF